MTQVNLSTITHTSTPFYLKFFMLSYRGHKFILVSNTSTPFYLNFFLSYDRVLVYKSRQDGTSVDTVSKFCPSQLINQSGIILQYYYSKMDTRTPLMNLTLFPATGAPLFLQIQVLIIRTIFSEVTNQMR